MSTTTSPTGRATIPVAELDWALFDEPGRSTFMARIDEEQAERSQAIARLVNLAATVAGSDFAQLSLIDDTQFVPASSGLTYGPDDQHTRREDSLCSVTMTFGETLVIEDAASHPWVSDLPPVTSGAVGAYLGAPVVSETGVCVGAICVFDVDPRPWSAATRAAVTDLAALTAREVDLIGLTGSRADTLEALTEVVHDIAAVDREALDVGGAVGRHRPASDTEIGGDWIDCAEFDDGLAFTVGDTAGHGLGSVAVMSTLLAASRAYHLEGHRPAVVLSLLDELLAEQRPGAMATAIHGRLDRSRHEFALASAGHLPPILVRDGAARLVDLAPGPPLGVLHGAAPEPVGVDIDVRPGDSLVVYTDGLVERPGETIDVGIDALIATVERVWADSDDPHERVDRLIASRHGTTDDDQCVLVVAV